MTRYVLMSIFSIIAILLIFAAFRHRLELGAQVPKADRGYWGKMNGIFKKGYIVGSLSSAVAVIGIFIKHPIISEICCITLLSAMILPLAFLSRKTNFELCDESIKLQKRQQLLLLAFAFGILFLTQQVFTFFNSLSQK